MSHSSDRSAFSNSMLFERLFALFNENDNEIDESDKALTNDRAREFFSNLQREMDHEILKLKKQIWELNNYKYCKYLSLYVGMLEYTNFNFFLTLNKCSKTFDKYKKSSN